LPLFLAALDYNLLCSISLSPYVAFVRQRPSEGREPMSKVLIVDKSIDRKKRIAALKERGLSVFPALQLAEARSRCKPGAYDLIIVNAQDEPEAAATFCDELGARTPAQAVLLAVSHGSGAADRQYVVQGDPQMLAERAAALLGTSPTTQDGNQQESQEPAPVRVSA
jgi:hypothetical protein